ncbi:MAG: hypothetical protein WBM83_02245, partial [Flavobacteriaceae bacterium]
DTGRPDDNTLYFNIDKKDRIKVLAIDSGNEDFLERIYTEPEFEFKSFALNQLDYGILNEQHLIILHGLENIPNSLTTSLTSFKDQGGYLAVIPATTIDFDSYNTLTRNLLGSSFREKMVVPRSIGNISFSHPLFKQVFEKKVSNFQYPKVAEYYKIHSALPTALAFEDNQPFLVGDNGSYLFSAAINGENSNFKDSPLIVPTFYNIGVNSLKLPELYQVIGEGSVIDIPYTLQKDDILKIVGTNYIFIPQQLSLANKVTLNFQNNEMPDGIYTITDGENSIKNISFNQARDESSMNFLNLSEMNATSTQYSVTALFDTLQKNSTINALWKWFVILALLFLLLEIIIQKYL